VISALPGATYRLQLHKEFTFKDATDQISYLKKLGVTHLYVSPILTAQPGSVHGYDVIDPTRVNPELGGEDGLRGFVAALRQAELGLIVDIVPNHMAVGGSENPWWADVLRLGRASAYADYFDIDWDCADPALRGKVLAPFLGSQYGVALESGDLTLGRDEDGRPVVGYFGTRFPIDPSDHAAIDAAGDAAFDVRHDSGRERLHQLLERQHYRLAWWGVAGDQINWRRFFDINGLAGLRTERPEVFDAVHATLFRLYEQGLIDGFRVDHVDGLSDPPGYCRRLRQRLTELQGKRPVDAAQGRAYLVIEKILGAGEDLSGDWDVDGTSGYDFMNQVSKVQHDAGGKVRLEALWHALSGRPDAFDVEEKAARSEIVLASFNAQLQSTCGALQEIARRDPKTRDVSLAAIQRGMVALLQAFPVYRTYNAGQRRTGSDVVAFDTALTEAEAATAEPVRGTLRHLDRWLGSVADPDFARAQTRFQQLSAPVAAKAVEDTAFYRYGRLLSRNDVGFDAAVLGDSAAAFHEACLARRASFPHAMLATATHDHKRGEDVRARLAVISARADAWAEVVERLRAVPGERPAVADEVMLYQMIVGAWPLDLHPADAAGLSAFAERLAGWQQKALREAKLITSWIAPNEAYEARAKQFLEATLSPTGGFVRILHDFVEDIAPAGAINGLSQAVLKMTTPGMPDFFQGTELWDFSLVDPDNRRPVDYGARRGGLEIDAPLSRLLVDWRTGAIKQAVISRILRLRRQHPALFTDGSYSPIDIRCAAGDDRFVAFTRTFEQDTIVVVLPRLGMGASADLRLPETLLEDFAVSLPAPARGALRAVFTGADVTSAADVRRELASFPILVLTSGSVT
jgi:(1->4)-alpha-D-glucan 1-alpha-D-glucosylmutase